MHFLLNPSVLHEYAVSPESTRRDTLLPADSMQGRVGFGTTAAHSVHTQINHVSQPTTTVYAAATSLTSPAPAARDIRRPACPMQSA